jgi:hypothetical protein
MQVCARVTAVEKLISKLDLSLSSVYEVSV